MPLYLKLPHNPEAFERLGGYPEYLNLVGRKTTALHRKLRKFGLAGWESATQASLLAVCESLPQITFYDVGSHFGIYSALVSTIYGSRSPQVFAFEPTPQTAKLARGIINRNKLNITFEEVAITSHDTLCLLYLSAKAETSNSLTKGFRISSRALTVFGRSIDSLVASGLPPPTLIKIDVATHEAAVFRGALSTIERHRPHIICELNSKMDLKAFACVVGRLRDIGYVFYRIPDENEVRTGAALLNVVEGAKVVQRVTRKCRNWLISPARLAPAIVRNAEAWRGAIDACTAERNLETKKGEVPAGLFNL